MSQQIKKHQEILYPKFFFVNPIKFLNIKKEKKCYQICLLESSSGVLATKLERGKTVAKETYGEAAVTYQNKD